MRYKVRHNIKHLLPRKSFLIAAFLLFLLVFSVGINLYNNVYPQSAVSILKADATSDISILSSRIVDKYLSENKNSSYLNVRYDASQKVSSYSADTVLLERTRFQITELIGDKLKRKNKAKVKIPIGSLCHNTYLTGKGFKITLNAEYLTAVTADVVTEIENVGINQALYRAVIIIKIDCKIIVSGETESFTVTSKHTLDEKLIFGDVPLT
ncbi:MAG: sporulation protein YunB [Clostridia bacterium]|nr:sporulation protein YunB [Clostridia bacterium]